MGYPTSCLNLQPIDYKEGWLQSQSGRFGEQKNFLTLLEYALLTTLSQLPYYQYQ
jgi:hypothetical protein